MSNGSLRLVVRERKAAGAASRQAPAALVSTGKRFRGEPASGQDASHLPDIAPKGPLEGDPGDQDWCGHGWSAWVSIREALRLIPCEATGLYRLRILCQADLIYIGQGLVRARLLAHLSKLGQPMHRQCTLFAGPLGCSWVIGASWLPHQRLELENDVIAAYVLSSGTTPQAQFLG